MAWVMLALFAPQVSSQQIVLRDLTLVENVTVSGIDDQALTLSDGRSYPWDQILQATVGESWQSAVDAKIESIGLPLYRLKHRLQREDVAGAFLIAENHFGDGPSAFADPEARFLVCRTVMLGRMKEGQMAAAIDPMIRALQLQPECSDEFLGRYPFLAFARDELQNSIHEPLLPVWESPQAAADALRQLESNHDLNALMEIWPGLAVYGCSLAYEAGDAQLANRWMPLVETNSGLRSWQPVLGRDLSRVPLARITAGQTGALRVATMFWWATESEQIARPRQRMLTLLKIVAAYRDRYPQLARRSLVYAASLSENESARRILKEAIESP